MSLIQTLKNLIAPKGNPFPQSKQVIEFAFEIGGVKYYRHVDEANMPYKRALKAISVYNEISMRCDRHYLVKHTEAVDSILGGTKFTVDSLVKLKQLNNQIKERLTWIYDEDLVYKLAAVRYFDASENPEDFDWRYAAKKIDLWKQHEDVGRFFLRQPISSLIPFLKDSDVNFLSYSEVNQQLNRAHLESIYSNLSEDLNRESVTPSERLFWEETRPGNRSSQA